MQDICLELSKFDALKMLDLQKKYAIDSFKRHVSIQARKCAFSAIQYNHNIKK
jgi:hypothetical protein